jgi:hypothetical protein
MIKLKKLLKEIGEGVTPYKWSGPEDRIGSVEYYFTTEDNDYYKVKFVGTMDNDWGLAFYANNDSGVITNKGRQFKIISTIMDIIKSFVEEYPVDLIRFTGSDKEGATTNQRDLLYRAYLNKNINKLPGYHAEMGTTYLNIIRDEPLLKEIGEGTTPYNWTGPEDDFGYVNYFFTTEDNDYYNVIFTGGVHEDIEDSWSINFFVKNDTDIETWNSGTVTNKGRQFKVISTIMDIIKNFIEEYPANIISFTGSDKEDSETNQRDLLYQAYVKKNIHKFPEWKYEIHGNGGVDLIRKDQLPGMSLKQMPY